MKKTIYYVVTPKGKKKIQDHIAKKYQVSKYHVTPFTGFPITISK